MPSTSSALVVVLLQLALPGSTATRALATLQSRRAAMRILAGFPCTAAAAAAAADVLCGEEDAGARPVLDTKRVPASAELERLERILRAVEADTGFRVRVLTRERNSAEWTRSRTATRCALGVASAGGQMDPRAVVLIADRGIPGALENGSSYLTFDIGDAVRFVLPDVFWARLQREYGKRTFVEARGEAASVIVSCELVISCLRNEEYCTGVPPAASSFF